MQHPGGVASHGSGAGIPLVPGQVRLRAKWAFVRSLLVGTSNRKPRRWSDFCKRHCGDIQPETGTDFQGSGAQADVTLGTDSRDVGQACAAGGSELGGPTMEGVLSGVGLGFERGAGETGKMGQGMSNGFQLKGQGTA